MVNYEEAVKKPFTDIMKLVIGIVLSIIPIVNFTIVTGFALENSGLGKNKPSKKMPEWKDWGSLFTKGLAAAVIKLIYLLPAIAVIAVSIGLALNDIVNTLVGAEVSPAIMNQLNAGQFQYNQLSDIIRGNWHLILPTILIVAPILLVGIVLALVGTFLAPMAVLNYLKNKKFSKAFDIGAVARKALTVNYFLAWLTVVIIGIVLGVILSVIPLLGPAIAFFVVGVIEYSLYGQVYRKE